MGRAGTSCKDEEIFLANYSDGLTDAPLPDMIDRFKKSGKIGCFIAIHPPISFHLAEFDDEGRVQRFTSDQIRDLDQRRIFHFPARKSSTISSEGEELVLEPFNRLIEGGRLMAYKYEGFWRAMDTLRIARSSRTWWSEARCHGGAALVSSSDMAWRWRENEGTGTCTPWR